MDYVLDTDGRTHVPVPLTHNVTGFWDYFGTECGYLREPEDLYIAADDTIYIADTGNNRIVRLDSDGNYLGSYTDNGKLSSPKGIYVDRDGDLYISDSGNRRIVHLSPKGEFIEEFVKPESDLLEKDMNFEPTRIGLNAQGYLCTIQGQYFMSIDAHNQFMGFVSTNKVGFSLRSLLIRMFATQKQKAKLLKEKPASYNSFDIGPDELIYAVTDESVGTGQIQVINITGKNIYPVKAYGEKVDNTNPRFVDIAVSNERNIYVLERKSCRIYIYDQEGQLLSVFGGKGSTLKGRFYVPSALDVNSKGDVFVLDQQTGYLHRFARTAFFRKIVNAVNSYESGDYSRALEDWREVLDIDSNYMVANKGIAKSLQKFERYEEALAYFKTADDRDGYGKVFSMYRYGVFRENFGLIVLIIGICTVAALTLCIWSKGMADKILAKYFENGGKKPLNPVKKSLLMIFHPLDCIDIIKRGHTSAAAWVCPVFIGVTVLVNYVCIFITHYSIGSKTPTDANILLEAAIVAVPLISWVIAAYAMSAILNGESRFTELLTVSSYTLTPYIILTPILSLLSNIMGQSELGIYNSLRSLIILWVLILLFSAFKRMNDYTFGQAIGISALSLFAIIVMWAVILLLFSLTVQTVSFLQGLFEEFNMKYL